MRTLHDIEGLNLLDQGAWIGDTSLLTWPSAVVLNSSQGRFPVGSEPWVQATGRAASWAVREGFALLAGVDLSTWELSVAAASEALGAVILLAGVRGNWPASKMQGRLDDLAQQFNLSHQASLIVPYVESPRSPKSEWPLRDRWLVEHADLLLPVSVRNGGKMAGLLDSHGPGQRIDRSFAVNHAPRRQSFPDLPDPEASRKSLGEDWEGWAIHFTRSQVGPWPSETRIDYYRALRESGDLLPRGALATLGNIVQTETLVASARHMPLGKPAVGFTQLTPWAALQLMGWRQRYVEPSSEPYGVAVRSERLLELGAREVAYGPADAAKGLSAGERLFYQSVDPEGHDWSVERELRLFGNVELNNIPASDVRLLVREKSELNQLPAHPWEARAFG